jgi:RNA polymerase sigma-70 factor (ECF subfamily)
MTIRRGQFHVDYQDARARAADPPGCLGMSHAEANLAMTQPDPNASSQAARHDFIRGLFIEYSEALRGYIRRRVKNEADAAELVQEVYVRLMHLKCAEKLRRAPESYLFRTAINLVRDQHRRATARSADRHIPFEDEMADAPHRNPEALLASRQLSSLLREAISELSPKTREVLSLRLMEELSYREIGVRTNIPLRSIERYMSQALGHCSSRVAAQL